MKIPKIIDVDTSIDKATDFKLQNIICNQTQFIFNIIFSLSLRSRMITEYLEIE